jgi:hypothetical protein
LRTAPTAICIRDSRRDHAVAELARERQRLGAVGRHVQRNLVVEVDEAPIAMQVANLPAHPLCVVDRFAVVQQIVNHADLFAKLGLLDGRKTHHAPPGVSGAEAEDHAAWGELIDRRDRMDCHRRDTV